MAFPWLFECGFEDGTDGDFDAESDSTARLFFRHYSELAAIPGLPAPYRGAYCMSVNLATSTTTAYVQETGSFDTAAAGTIYVRFYFWFGGATGSPPVMANNDEFAIFQLWSGATDVEGGIYINYTTANGYRLGIGETAAASFLPLTLNQWHCVELKALVDSGVGDDGTLDGWLDGAPFAQVATLDQGAITSAVFGSMGQDAGTTRGYVLFDEIVADDARIYPITERFPSNLLMTKSGHAFVGPGTIENTSLLSGAGTDCVLSVFDTDSGSVLDASNCKLELKNVVNNDIVDPAGVPVEVYRGAYIVLSGTTPRAQVHLGKCQGYSSDGAIRTIGRNRKPRANNT